MIAPLTGFGILESWIYLSPVAAIKKVGPAPFLDSTAELPLVGGSTGEPHPKGQSSGKLSLTLLSHEVS